MTVATLRLVLRVKPCHNPREKRRRTQAIMDKMHRNYNVSVAAFDDDEPSRATLAVVAVARSRREARALLVRVVDAVAIDPCAELLSHEIHEV
jgi:uncharacterized protein YlxP (DUF503 family)